MPKKMLIDATHAEETRVVVVDGNKVEEFDFESENKRQLAGNIYLAKVTRVEPSLQAAFIDYGGNRHGFLAFSEVHPDYYHIPGADREALLAEERAYAKAQAEEDEEKRAKSSRSQSRSRSRSRSKPKAEDSITDDAIITKEASISGMDVVDLDDQAGARDEASDEDISTDVSVNENPVDSPLSGKDGADADRQENDVASAADETPEDDEVAGADAAERDESIENVADDDVTEEIRRPRKQRPRKYKIQEVIKLRQVLLVQVVKEERGNKGAALTTYLSLARRYCVLMQNTARGGGISRKITNAADRKKLKDIAGAIEVPDGAGLIIRTAGAQRTKTEIKRDYEYLQRLWEQIRELTLKSIAPAKIYEEGDLIKRSIRDLYNKEIDEVFVEGEAGYRVAKDFMKMIMPSHAKTNLEAAEEVVRQLRLRDLAGLIVIDFIDMEERRNNSAVEKRFKDRLKSDRARIQVGRISGFGLMEMSRQRLRPGMLEATTQPCSHCHGTGLIRSDENLSLSILRQLEEEGVRRRSREVLVKAPVGIVNFLVNQKREHIAGIEARYGLSVRIEADPFLISPDFSIEKFKSATRIVADVSAPVVSVDASLMADVDEQEAEMADAAVADAESTQDAPAPKKRRRRRRRRRSSGQGGDAQAPETQEASNGQDASETALSSTEPAKVVDPVDGSGEAAADDVKPARKVTRSRSSKSKTAAKTAAEPDTTKETIQAPKAESERVEPEAKPKTRRASSSAKKSETAAQIASTDSVGEDGAGKPKRATKARSGTSKAKQKAKQVDAQEDQTKAPAGAPEMADAVSVSAVVASEPARANPAPEKPKKKGWWSLGK